MARFTVVIEVAGPNVTPQQLCELLDDLRSQIPQSSSIKDFEIERAIDWTDQAEYMPKV